MHRDAEIFLLMLLLMQFGGTQKIGTLMYGGAGPGQSLGFTKQRRDKHFQN